MSDAVLKVESLKVHFPVKGGLFTKKQVVKAVDGVSFEIYPKETFGLVGEAAVEKVRPDGPSSSCMSQPREASIIMVRMLPKSEAAILRNSAEMCR